MLNAPPQRTTFLTAKRRSTTARVITVRIVSSNCESQTFRFLHDFDIAVKNGCANLPMFALQLYVVYISFCIPPHFNSPYPRISWWCHRQSPPDKWDFYPDPYRTDSICYLLPIPSHMHCVNVRPCPKHLTNPSHFAGLRHTKTPRAAQALQLPPVASAFRWDVTFFNLFIHPLHVSLSPLLVFWGLAICQFLL